MRHFRTLAFLLVLLAFSIEANAQVPSAAGPDRNAPPASTRPAPRPYDSTASGGSVYSPGGPSVIRRTMPYGDENASWGYRNPGNVGRMGEYYPPNNQFQNENATTHVAKFDQGPAATQRSAQMQGEQLGIQRYNAIQSHIDRYGSPMRVGFGFGFGGYGFPY